MNWRLQICMRVVYCVWHRRHRCVAVSRSCDAGWRPAFGTWFSGTGALTSTVLNRFCKLDVRSWRAQHFAFARILRGHGDALGAMPWAVGGGYLEAGGRQTQCDVTCTRLLFWRFCMRVLYTKVRSLDRCEPQSLGADRSVNPKNSSSCPLRVPVCPSSLLFVVSVPTMCRDPKNSE